jgi:hypothetical protein
MSNPKQVSKLLHLVPLQKPNWVSRWGGKCMGETNVFPGFLNSVHSVWKYCGTYVYSDLNQHISLSMKPAGSPASPAQTSFAPLRR